LSLADASISASGIAVQGRHILDPRSGQPAPRQTRAWALAGSGAQSDALSTAFFVMTDEEVAAFCREHPMIGAALTQRDGTLRTFGALSGRLV
jgi:thiamine biosynthesis lipoprotein